MYSCKFVFQFVDGLPDAQRMRLLAEMFDEVASIAPSQRHYISEYIAKADGVVSLIALRPDISKALTQWLAHHEKSGQLSLLEPSKLNLSA